MFPTVFFEGNLGSGKTTLLEKIAKTYPNFFVGLETIEYWRNLGGGDTKPGFNLLEALYRNEKRWGEGFQSLALLSMAQQYDSAPTDRPRFFHRSLGTVQKIFSQRLFRQGKICSGVYNVLESQYNLLKETRQPTCYVYLKVSPETAFKRISKRCRPEEGSMKCDLVTLLDTLHSDWLGEASCPVYVLDGEQDPDSVYEEFLSILPKILNGS